MESWMPYFVVVTAVAVVFQAIVLVALFLQVRRTAARVQETMERLRLQLIHVDQILTGAMEAVEEAGSRLRDTVWGPVVKASAIIRGIQTGLEFFRATRHGHQSAEQPAEQQDEGMFI